MQGSLKWVKLNLPSSHGCMRNESIKMLTSRKTLRKGYSELAVLPLQLSCDGKFILQPKKCLFLKVSMHVIV